MNTKIASFFLVSCVYFGVLLNTTSAETLEEMQSTQCFKYKGNIEAGKVKQGEVFGINISSPSIFVYQNKEMIPTKKEEDIISRPLDFSIDITGDASLLRDKDYFTSVKLENPKKEMLITFDSVIQGRDFYFILTHSSNYYAPVLYISTNGTDYEKIEYFYIKNYAFKYVKIVFEPKPTKKAEEDEDIFVSEIQFIEKIYTHVLKATNAGAVDIYSHYDCPESTPLELEGSEELQKDSQKFEVELQAFGGKSQKEKASPIYNKTKDFAQGKTTKVFPGLDQIVATIVLGLIILSIALYIRSRAKSKDFGILPQKVIKVKRKKVVKKVKNFLVEKHKKISTLGISSINLLIKGKRKIHEIKSKKLIKILKLMLSHYEENKNTFFPGELKNIYINVIDDFKEDLSKKTHKKAIDIINEFIEKGGKVIINMKDKK